MSSIHNPTRIIFALLALTAAGCGGAAFSIKDEVITDEAGPDTGADPEAGTMDDGADAAMGDAPMDGPGIDSHVVTTDSDSPPEDGGPVVVPPGWQLVEAAFSATAPAACGAAWATNDTVLFDGLNAPPATCGCSCGTPTSVQCSLPAKSCTYDPVQNVCNCTPTQSFASGQCLPTAIGGAGGSPVASGGSCAATPSTTVPPLSWSGRARVCEPTSTTTLPDPGFHLCIEQAGDVACPSTIFVNAHVEHVGVTDDRACSTCSCGAPSGTACGGTIATFKDPSCTQPNSDIGLNPTACSGYTGGGVEYQATPSGGTCAASNVSPTGAATATGTTTVCCR